MSVLFLPAVTIGGQLKKEITLSKECRKRRIASRTRNGGRRVANSAPAHLMARVLGVKAAAVARTAKLDYLDYQSVS